MGIKRGAIYNLRDKDDVSAAVLERFCRHFNMNPMEFFDDDVVANPLKGTTTYIQQKIVGRATMNCADNDKISGLEKQLELKDQIIAEKEKTIQFLMKLIEHPDIDAK